MLRRMLMLGVFALAACAYIPMGTVRVAPQAEPSIATAGRPHTPELLDRLVGHWVLTGVIGRQSVVHDVDANWVLDGNYVRISEISRERGDNGQPKYEATIFIGWLETAHHFVCIWLDNTEVASGGVTCVAAEAPNSLPFEFRDEHGALMIATTFAYHRDDDTWEWQIDNIRDGRAVRFANLSLHRR